MADRTPTPKRIGLSRSSSRKGFQSPVAKTVLETSPKQEETMQCNVERVPLSPVSKISVIRPLEQLGSSNGASSSSTVQKTTPVTRQSNASAPSYKKFNSPVVAAQDTGITPRSSTVPKTTPLAIETSSRTPSRAGTSAKNVALKRKFNSPLVAGTSTEGAKKKPVNKSEGVEVDKEIEDYLKKGYKIEDCDKYVRILHEYNDVKDAAQIVFGRLAEFEGVTVKVIHQRYGLSETD